MAYLKNITFACEGCRRSKASVQLYGHRNDARLRYCKRCGNIALKMLKRDEGQS